MDDWMSDKESDDDGDDSLLQEAKPKKKAPKRGKKGKRKQGIGGYCVWRCDGDGVCEMVERSVRRWWRYMSDVLLFDARLGILCWIHTTSCIGSPVPYVVNANLSLL